MGFFRTLLEHRVAGNILFVVVLLAGVFSVTQMPVEEYPNVSFDQIEVQTLYLGASPVEVERLVTKKLEDEIEEVRGIEWVRSRSSQDYSRILIKAFDDIDDFDELYRDVESAVRRALPELPEKAEEPVVTKIEVESLNPVVMVILGGPVGEEVLRDAADDLEGRLEAIPGVRTVRLTGRRERELIVDVDPDRLAAHDLTIGEVAAAVGARVNVPSGKLEEGGVSMAVRALGEVEAPADLLASPVRSALQGGVVRLGEVARVTEGYEELLVRPRFLGGPCITLSVVKLADASSLDIRADIDRVAEAWRKERAPEGLEVAFIADTTVRIRKQMETLEQNIGLGGIFMVVMLALTIGLRMSLLALVGVVFAFFGTFSVLHLLGQSINVLSLFGLVLVSGMLVDDAIVVLENIVRRRELGEPLGTACVEGVKEVAWPVAASIATTIAAFVPLLLMTGITGKFFSAIPIAVCAALLMSLFEVVFLLPIHVFEVGTGRSREAPAAAGPSFAQRVLRPIVALATTHRYLAAALLVLLFAGTAALSSRIRTFFFPNEYRMFFVNVKLPVGATIEESGEVLDGVDRLCRSLPEVESAVATAGFYWDFNYQPHVSPSYGQLVVTLVPRSERDRSVPEIMADLRERMPTLDLRGATFEVTELNDGPPIGRPVSLQVQAADLERLERVSTEVERVVATLPGVKDVVSSLEVGKVEAYARLDPDVASVRGVSAADVGAALATANEGAVVATFKGPDEDWDLRVRIDPAFRRSLADLRRIEVRSAAGARVPLGDVCELAERPTYASVGRFRGERTVSVTADVDPRVTSSLEANRALKERLAGLLAANPDVSILFSGEFEETERSFASLQRAFAIALLVMFMILGAQFRSYVQPLVVLCSVPFALVGVVSGLYLTGDPLTVPVLLGVVGLAGVAVNDAIVLLDFANRARARGATALDAIREAAAKRIRPLMLTSLTTIAGLLPTALGLGSEGRSVVWGPMATAFSFGIASATIMTVVATPPLYLIADDLTRLVRRLARRGAPPPPETVPEGWGSGDDGVLGEAPRRPEAMV